MSWSRSAGPHLELQWLRNGVIAEPIPQWFVDFFLGTRDIAAVKPAESDSCTMTTLEDNWCLYRIASLARPARSLEIGVMRGSSSITIAKAYADSGIDCEQIAVDIDPDAVRIAADNIRRHGLNSSYKPVLADSRIYLRESNDRYGFVFLDADHHYETVAIEIAESFSRTEPGGYIVLHDTGSVLWGTSEDPGLLFFRVLDNELGNSAEMTWMDSTSCGNDMLLRTSLGLHSTVPPISTGIAVGYGGLGIIRKLDNARTLDVGRLMSLRPVKPVFAGPLPPESGIRRGAKRIARMLGI